MKALLKKKGEGQGLVGPIGQNKMDRIADTPCAGINWMMIEDTGQCCDVYPYKKGYSAKRDILIGTCATLVKGASGSNFIVIRHEMLYFEQKMKRSLLIRTRFASISDTTEAGCKTTICNQTKILGY